MFPDPHCAARMLPIDRLSPPLRALANEYGANIVLAMIEDGYRDPDQLRVLLPEHRRRRQEEWLATDYVTKRTANSFRQKVFA